MFCAGPSFFIHTIYDGYYEICFPLSHKILKVHLGGQFKGSTVEVEANVLQWINVVLCGGKAELFYVISAGHLSTLEMSTGQYSHFIFLCLALTDKQRAWERRLQRGAVVGESGEALVEESRRRRWRTKSNKRNMNDSIVFLNQRDSLASRMAGNDSCKQRPISKSPSGFVCY